MKKGQGEFMKGHIKLMVRLFCFVCVEGSRYLHLFEGVNGMRLHQLISANFMFSLYCPICFRIILFSSSFPPISLSFSVISLSNFPLYLYLFDRRNFSRWLAIWPSQVHFIDTKSSYTHIIRGCILVSIVVFVRGGRETKRSLRIAHSNWTLFDRMALFVSFPVLLHWTSHENVYFIS